MTQKTVSAADRVAVIAAINPASLSTGAHSTGWISMANIQQIMAVIQTGVLGASATLDARLQQARDGAGDGAKDVEGAAIETIVKASGDNKQAVITAWAEDLDMNDGFTHARLTLTVGEAASIAGAVLLGLDERYGPARGLNAASVAEVVSL